MTKQPPSATRLQLSRLFRWLAVLCFMKLAILGMLLPDLGPALHTDGAPQEKTSEQPAPAASPPQDVLPHAHLTAPQEAAPADQVPAAVQRSEAPPPQGSAAASLAAEARPHSDPRAPSASLPAPLIGTGTAAVDRHASPAFAPFLPEPQALPAPVAQPGTNAPRPALLLASAQGRKASESGWLDALSLSRLPIPGLGSVQAAHAAALDMPVPQTPGASQSPFMPAEQTAPLHLPGAPAIPPGIPRGQSTDGAPLPPRTAAGADGPILPSLPGGASPNLAPAPFVHAAPTSPDADPHLKTQELARQQQDILVLRQQMDQRLKDIQNAEQKMKDMIREARGLEDEKIRRLVLTYTQMKPKAAAKALESMEERVAIRILSGMSPKQSGDILTYVNPEKTAKLTELITRMRLPE